MTTNIETIKGEYLKEFNRSIPRLKELAKVLRAEDNKQDGHTPESASFWNLTSDPRKNYELCQLAQDLDAMNDFWASIPANPQSSPTNDHEGDRSESLYSNLKTNTALAMDKLAKLEALLGLILASMDSHEDNSAISLALDLTQDAFEILDVKIDLPISSL